MTLILNKVDLKDDMKINMILPGSASNQKLEAKK